ncbi:alpha-1:2-mannosyltransferase ALG9-like protein [Dinothrombium tinctorium]|uniref:Mannosyltransferase n=1 Tax=Dinothrombium tinctorium TaxID=1965070 RepID=A0A3S3PH99_9ACAR|nr:alpha-1:2-mannosyltransferase ALG9-like protein [Dinothrombium tinctorium]
MGARSRKGAKGGHHSNQNQQKAANAQSSIASSSKALQTAAVKPSFNRQISNEKKDANAYTIGTLLGPWSPQSATAFKALLSARLCAAVWSNIADCDETFNYWEPSHYLIHGTGFQTWEYSPIGVVRQFGPNIARLVLCFLVVSSGMFISSTAFLPSTFSMYMTFLIYGAWFQQHYRIVILSVASSVLIGWPFSAILSIPVAIDLFLMKKRRFYFIKWSLITGFSILIPLVAVDSHYYGKLVIAPVNIIAYNVFSKHGANLYGVEPWQFYFINCSLNFNLVFVTSLLAFPIMLMCKFLIKSKRNIVNSSHWICLAALYLWFLTFFPQSHKEERFLFPCYPLLCLCAAFALEMIHKAITNVIAKLSYLYSAFVLFFIVIFTLLSFSRCLALYKGYHAPMDIYMELGRIHHENNVSSLPHHINVCVGKEWHRFPNSFFLPDATHWKLQFVKSEFSGQLPKPYGDEPWATRSISTQMNDENKEEPTRYVNASDCHFLIDTDYPQYSEYDPPYSRNSDDWEIVCSHSFLDNRNSPPLWRAFYVPFVTEMRCSYVNYNLLKNKNLAINSTYRNLVKDQLIATVVLDTTNMGNDVVIVKNGHRICGTGAALATAPIVQNKAYFEVKLQQTGVWGVGLATINANLNRVPLGCDAESWVLRNDGTICHNNEILHRLKDLPMEGDIIGITYDHIELKFLINNEFVDYSLTGIRGGELYPVLYVDDGAILDSS